MTKFEYLILLDNDNFVDSYNMTLINEQGIVEHKYYNRDNNGNCGELLVTIAETEMYKIGDGKYTINIYYYVDDTIKQTTIENVIAENFLMRIQSQSDDEKIKLNNIKNN